MTETTQPILTPERVLDRFIRGWNNALGIWRLCRTKKCARSRACHGACARRCYCAHVALLPESLQIWFHEIADAHEEGLTYDQAIERMEDDGVQTALEDWHEAINYCDKLLKVKNLTWPPLKAK